MKEGYPRKMVPVKSRAFKERSISKIKKTLFPAEKKSALGREQAYRNKFVSKRKSLTSAN